MNRHSIFLAAILVSAFASTSALAQNLAPTPPMGWNSWDAYGLTIDEADFRANTTVLAGMKQFGWQYSVIDEGWYMQDPFAKKVEARKYLWDANGILIPVVSRFPSSAGGAGFKPLADWVHAQGLKFGIHIVRGIPRQVVKENLPIGGSSFHAGDAGDTTETCPWDEGNYGVKDNAAGQAYYDDMLMKYARWGLDYIKVDCVSDHPYRPTEIRQVSEAIRKTGRPIVLSLSPGPTSLENAPYVAKYSQLWRISDDHWDVWSAAHKDAGTEFPFGLRDAFDRLAKWAPLVKPGAWPDEDMLPLGWLGPHPGWGEARKTRYTQDEQRTEFTLWAIARSPLIFGGNLTKLDEFTKSLMTNKEVTGINQKATESKPVTNLPAGFENARVWRVEIGKTDRHPYFAFFNLDDKAVILHTTWAQIGVESGKHPARNVWDGNKVPAGESIDVSLRAHGSAIFKIE